jgi:hypothetical protein
MTGCSTSTSLPEQLEQAGERCQRSIGEYQEVALPEALQQLSKKFWGLLIGFPEASQNCRKKAAR